MRCAIYARYSSDRQSPRSIEDQMTLCREFIAGKGGSVVEAYTDYAISGETASRPSFARMIEDVAKGRFEAIVAEAMDRLSRDQADIALLHRKCRFHGVRLLTVSEGEVRELEIGLKGTMNALFLRDLAAKTKRGQQGRIDAGLAAGGLTYGYDVVRELGPDGELRRGRRAINQAQADVVRRIFADYNAGASPRAIAHALNKEGIAAPRGGQWTGSTINGSRTRRNGVLHNELYIGLLVWNRQSFRKDPETGRRLSRPNPQGDWKVVEVPELRIVEDAQWDLAQARTAGRKRPLHQTRRAKRLLSGLVTCGQCGDRYTVTTRTWMQCFGYREKGTCDNHLMIEVDELERRVLDGLRASLLTPALMAEFAREYRDHVRRLRKSTTGRRAALEKEVRELTKELANLVEAIARTGISDALKTRLLAAEGRQQEVKAELAAMGEQSPVELHPNLPEVFRRKVEALQASLAGDEAARRQAAEILRTLIDAIVLEPNAEGRLDVRLRGHLAAILNLAGRKPGEAVTGLLVAGAGYQLHLLVSVRARLDLSSSRSGERDPANSAGGTAKGRPRHRLECAG